MYFQGALDKYITDLSAKKMTPGGGSASAASAAIGAALNLMVINYSFKKDGTVDNELLALQTEQTERMNRLSVLLDEDCVVFRKLMNAVSSGEVSPEDYIEASRVPVEICKECCLSAKVSRGLLGKANSNLMTDIGCAALILRGAFLAAELNVKINLARVDDQNAIKDVTETLGCLKKEICGITDKVSDHVSGVIDGRG